MAYYKLYFLVKHESLMLFCHPNLLFFKDSYFALSCLGIDKKSNSESRLWMNRIGFVHSIGITGSFWQIGRKRKKKFTCHLMYPTNENTVYSRDVLYIKRDLLLLCRIPGGFQGQVGG